MNRDEFIDDLEEDDEDPDYEPIEEDEDDEDMELEMEERLERAVMQAGSELVDADDDDDHEAELVLDGEESESTTIRISELLNNAGRSTSNSARTLGILASLFRMTRAEEVSTIASSTSARSRSGSADWQAPYTRHYQYSAASEPDQRGVELANSGLFGRPDAVTKSKNAKGKGDKRVRPRKEPLQRRLRDAKRRLEPAVRNEIFRDVVPNTIGTVVARYGSNAYAGQFSTDSSFYYTCVQDFRLHIYDTKSPLCTPRSLHIDGDHQSTMQHKKTIRAAPGGWTITDSHLSPDNTLLAYAIMSPTVFVASVQDGEVNQRSLFFGNNRREYEWHDRYGVWSCRFSADGKELVAGGSQKIMVYDLIADRRSIKIEAHNDDVNSCCWADSGTNILISASDDSFIKVWDRRSFGASHRPSGVLIGHTEGITYVSPKGDGRYIVSNGKDQTLKLWDLRKMGSYKDWVGCKDTSYFTQDFDYRHQEYPRPRYDHHPQDCSVMSYRGHSVLRTLIRCNFSPAETTGSRYIYSGSADGQIHIWNLDGTVVQKLDRRNVLDMGHHPSDTEIPVSDYSPRPLPRNRTRGDLLVVRDVAWHSQEPVLMSASWSSNERHASEVARHEWKGLNKLGGRLEDFVEREKQEAEERRRRLPSVTNWSRGGWY